MVPPVRERRPPVGRVACRLGTPTSGRHSGPQGRGGEDPNRRDGSRLGTYPQQMRRRGQARDRRPLVGAARRRRARGAVLLSAMAQIGPRITAQIRGVQDCAIRATGDSPLAALTGRVPTGGRPVSHGNSLIYRVIRRDLKIWISQWVSRTGTSARALAVILAEEPFGRAGMEQGRGRRGWRRQPTSPSTASASFTSPNNVGELANEVDSGCLDAFVHSEDRTAVGESPAAGLAPRGTGFWPSHRDHSRRRRGLGATPNMTEAATEGAGFGAVDP